jgi:Holliday junction DNA helicase RuvA
VIAKRYGVVDTIFDDRVLLNVHGVCYEVLCPSVTMAKISINADVVLWIEHIIREDSQFLCGFLSYEEKLWFREITKVNGVGAKVALSILSAVSLQNIAFAICYKDAEILTRANGVGTKVAERIVSELKNSKLLLGENIACLPEHLASKTEVDVIEALVSLGYDRLESKNAVTKIENRMTLSTEELLKVVLSRGIGV